MPDISVTNIPYISLSLGRIVVIRMTAGFHSYSLAFYLKVALALRQGNGPGRRALEVNYLAAGEFRLLLLVQLPIPNRDV